jgi:hypothetical protein
MRFSFARLSCACIALISALVAALAHSAGAIIYRVTYRPVRWGTAH